MKAAVVILHYQNSDVTEECLSWLDRSDYCDRLETVVVDNCSPNGSGKALQEKYKSRPHTHFLMLVDNIGFAGGNNEGYKYAREKLHADTILVINSDLFIKDPEFFSKLEGIIEDNPEDSIIAPDIESRYGVHQNPFRLRASTDKEHKRIILRKRTGQIIYRLPLINKKLIKRNAGSSTPKKTAKTEEELFDIIPHGACMIFTPQWVRREPFAFREGSFLFIEEEILFDYCRHKGYRTHYVPQLIVYHMEDASQDAAFSSLLAGKKKRLKYEIQSRRLLLKYRRDYKEKK